MLMAVLLLVSRRAREQSCANMNNVHLCGFCRGETRANERNNVFVRWTACHDVNHLFAVWIVTLYGHDRISSPFCDAKIDVENVVEIGRCLVNTLCARQFPFIHVAVIVFGTYVVEIGVVLRVFGKNG
jgi:hypothetical protein